MVSFELPTYYGVAITIYEDAGKYYMQFDEWSSRKTEISKEFYEVAAKEFGAEKEWK